MSYINFLRAGIRGDQDQYKYTETPKIIYSGYVENFKGHVVTIKKDDQSKTVQIDHVFTITTLSDKVIDKNKNLWSRLQKDMKMACTVTLIGGVGAALAAVTMGVLNPALLLPAIAVGAVALTLFTLSFFAQKRSREAEREFNEWSDATDKLTKRCKALNIHLKKVVKAKKAMKEEISKAIDKKSAEIIDMINKYPDVLIEGKKKSLATEVYSIWKKYSNKLLMEGGIKIPRKTIDNILDSYIKVLPLLQDVKDKIPK